VTGAHAVAGDAGHPIAKKEGRAIARPF